MTSYPNTKMLAHEFTYLPFGEKTLGQPDHNLGRPVLLLAAVISTGVCYAIVGSSAPHFAPALSKEQQLCGETSILWAFFFTRDGKCHHAGAALASGYEESPTAPKRPTGAKRPSSTGRTGDKTPKKQRTKHPPKDNVLLITADKDSPKKTQHFACPFYKADPHTHHHCGQFKSTRFGDVSQHIFRKHTPGEFYCPICWISFARVDARDRHLRTGGCTLVPEAGYRQQIEQHRLIRELPKRMDCFTKWFRSWDILFPGQLPPDSPYIHGNINDTIEVLRRQAPEPLQAFLAPHTGYLMDMFPGEVIGPSHPFIRGLLDTILPIVHPHRAPEPAQGGDIAPWIPTTAEQALTVTRWAPNNQPSIGWPTAHPEPPNTVHTNVFDDLDMDTNAFNQQLAALGLPPPHSMEVEGLPSGSHVDWNSLNTAYAFGLQPGIQPAEDFGTRAPQPPDEGDNDEDAPPSRL